MCLNYVIQITEIHKFIILFKTYDILLTYIIMIMPQTCLNKSCVRYKLIN